MGTMSDLRAPRILEASIKNGNWRLASPDELRRCLGGDLDDLQLFQDLRSMQMISEILDHAGFVEHPGFCMTRDSSSSGDDPRLCFPRALFIGGSIAPGDDVFVAIQQEDYEEYDPWVLVLDWRLESPNRWTPRCVLSELISGIQPDIPKSKMHPATEQLASPTVDSIEWGKIVVDGLGSFRDVKLYPGGGRTWDWTETDTHHVPGIQTSDVQELLDHGSEIIVLSRGMQLVLQTSPETIALLNKLQTPFVIEETKQAVATYNRLVTEGKRVGALFHSTC